MITAFFRRISVGHKNMLHLFVYGFTLAVLSACSGQDNDNTTNVSVLLNDDTFTDEAFTDVTYIDVTGIDVTGIDDGLTNDAAADERLTKDGLTANPDSASVAPRGSVTINVKRNDEGDTNRAIIETNVRQQASRGWLRVNQSAGTITYTPYSGQTGVDRFGYQLRVRGTGVSSPTTVTVSIDSTASSAPAQPGEPAVNKPPTDDGSENNNDSQVSISGGLTARHRSGQTFLTWTETGTQDEYHVYRHTAPITAGNLSSAKKLTSRWGPLGNDTSVNKYGSPDAPANFVIEDLGSPLRDNTGLFVYTTQRSDSATAFYAVTSVKNGRETFLNVKTLRNAVRESESQPRDVLTRSVNSGRGRTYTQYMDYSRWNPTLNGYAYNYSVALPQSYNRNQSYSLQIQLHAYGEMGKSPRVSQYDWQVIQLLPHNPGRRQGTRHTWWYGFAADHNFNSGLTPSSGRVENFTEQRVMRSVQELIRNPDFNVNEQLIHAYGNSMGASGVLSLGMRYGSVLSGVYASQPMTDYANSTVFRNEIETLWGSRRQNLKIINNGPYSQPLRRYNNIGVWDWMDHHQQLQNRRGDTFAYLMTTHGKRDNTIEWQSQGAPTVRAFTDANVGFSATYRDTTHTWTGFSSAVRPLFGFDNTTNARWMYPLNLSYPAIQRASGSSNITPSRSGTDSYNLNLEWATPHTPFDTTIVDTRNRYEITVKSNSGSQTANITPRRTQQFKANALQSCSWTATDRNNNRRISSGSVIADPDSLVTVRNFPIRTGRGTRLVITCS